jgi:hypothetical protein
MPTMPILKKPHYLLFALLALLPLAAISTGGMVFAQSPCGVQVGSIQAAMEYYGSYYYGQSNPWDIQLTVPISLSCPNAGGELWAVGNTYDTVANTNLGSANTVMNSYNGYYAGQLVFTLPPSVIEHLLQVQISVYSGYENGQYNSLVAMTSPTVTTHSTNYYYSPVNPNNGYYNGYPTYCYYKNGYMYCYYQSYYYYYSSPYYYSSGCSNGQAIIYYNGAYQYVICHRHDR